MAENSLEISRLKEVLKDATNDLKNADLPEFVGNLLVPVTAKAAEVVPAAAGRIPLPYVDRIGAFALSVPLGAMKMGYSIIPKGKKQETAKDQIQFLSALHLAGIDLDIELQKLKQGNHKDIPHSENDQIRFFKDQELEFLVEIVGCENLVSSKRKKVHEIDPYIVASFAGRQLHKTKHQRNTSPVYALRENAFFLWSISVKELFLSRGLSLEVQDFKLVGFDNDLGTAIIPPKDIYNANEERLVYDLIAPSYAAEDLESIVSRRTVAVRIRRATDYDKDFLSTYDEYENRNSRSNEKKEIRRDEQGISAIESIIESKVKMVVKGEETIEKYKVLPFPDPESFITSSSASTDSGGDIFEDDRIWKTTGEIETITLQPSRNYQQVGSGNIARVYLEVLACDNLPNMESFRFLGNKSDAFVQIVYEDCICKTDIINDKSNPRFLPWTNRAFMLHSNFPSSVINLGVFDYDKGNGIAHDHNFIGRASVDLASLRPDTEYNLTYQLFNTALLETREASGTIKIRLRMEVDNPRSYLLASLSLPPPRYVNCNTYKEFKCVHHTCYGERDMSKYSIVTIFELVGELMAYKRSYYYVVAFMRSLLLWRGSHHIMSVGERRILFPFNSLCVFAMAVTLVEKPYLLPAFSFLTLALILISTMKWRNNHPNPWWRCHSFFELVRVLLLGRYTSLPSETIEGTEWLKESEFFNSNWKELIEAAEENSRLQAIERAEEEEDRRQRIEDIVDVEISSTLGSKLNSLRVTKQFLFPIQELLLSICKWTRFTKNVILWEEPLSFWLTLLSFTLSIVFIKLHVVRRLMWVGGWIIKILIWILFGPWMKLVDIYILKTDFDIDKRKRAKKADNMRNLIDHEKTVAKMREKSELALKLREFRRYFFGKFLSKVHVLKYDRHIDTPLATSSAKPLCASIKQALSTSIVNECIESSSRKAGQRLVGLMIPKQVQINVDDSFDLNMSQTESGENGLIIVAMIVPLLAALFVLVRINDEK